MYCSNCGAKMDDDSAFCPECGARCEEAAKVPQDGAPNTAGAAQSAQEAPSAEQEAQSTAQQEPQAEASSTAAALAAAARRPQSGAASASGAPANSYFAAQFARIAAGEKPKFNWAAFFFAPFNQLYHGSTQVFKKTFLPYLIVMCLLMVANQIAASATLATFSLGALAVTGILGLASFGVGVWGFVLCILNGKNYTKKLYDQTQGRAEAVPALKSPVAVLLGALVAWGVVLGIISVVGAKSAADAWMEDLGGAYLEEDADWDEDWDVDTSESADSAAPAEEPEPAPVQETVSSPWLLGPQQNYWEGAWQDTYSGDIRLFSQFAAGVVTIAEETVDEDGYWCRLEGPSEDGMQTVGEISVDANGTQLLYYEPSQGMVGGMRQSGEFVRPAQPAADSLPQDFWGYYAAETDPSQILTIDAFSLDGYRYSNATDSNGRWTVGTGNGMEGWDETLWMTDDGRLARQSSYSTEPMYYTRVPQSQIDAQRSSSGGAAADPYAALPEEIRNSSDKMQTVEWAHNEIIGLWGNDDMSFEITASTYDNGPYVITDYDFSIDAIKVAITRNDGSVDVRWLSLYPNMIEVYADDFDGWSGTLITELYRMG